MALRLAWATDPGLEREENEDSVFVSAELGGLDALLVVADGMGGHASGQVASKLLAKSVSDQLSGGGDIGGEHLNEVLARANTVVFEASQATSENAGMGSTLVVVAIRDGRLGLLNVGDSPAYLFRNGAPQLISQDHSWPAEQVRLGVIKPEEAAGHPLKHRLTRAVGVWDAIQSFTDKMKIQEGDTVVLCSDGVETAGVSVEEMGKLLFEDGNLDNGTKRVIERCRELGAPDNVTLAVARVEVDVTKTATLPRIKV